MMDMKRLCRELVQAVKSVAFAITRVCLLLATTLLASTNPFEQVAEQAYSGRFAGPDISLRLKPEAGRWTGSIRFKGQNYTIQGENQDGKLTGTFGADEESRAFTATSDGDNITFTAGTFTARLTRQKMPKLAGVYASKRVKLDFQNRDGGLNGTITFHGQQFQFTATETAGELAGVFKHGDEPFPFTVVSDPAGLTFQTGNFSDVVCWSLQRFKATPFAHATRWTNSLGMVLVKVPGTEVLFSIWDTRVLDYQIYSANDDNLDGSWKNPGFTQPPNHPVVNVSWHDAKAFCQWLTAQERADGTISSNQSYRLPTDGEWSVAVGLAGEAGSTPKEKDLKTKGLYPWGTNWPPPSGADNYAPYLGMDNFTNTSAVGSFAANQFGLYDMGGNVWQWCEDWYADDQKYRVLRGASWGTYSPDYLLSSYRLSRAPDLRYFSLGFRCVLVSGSVPR